MHPGFANFPRLAKGFSFLTGVSGYLIILIAVITAPMPAKAQVAPELISSAQSSQEEKSEPLFPPQDSRATSSPETHRFWDRTNILLFSGVAISRALDYVSTRNMLARGRQEILLPDDVVYSTAGFPALEAAGTVTSIGISYLFHRTGHHSLERWLSIGHIGVTCFGAARNYSLKSGHH